MHKKGIDADIFISFETLEHFMDPISFLKRIAGIPRLKYFIITIPFVRKSRVGLEFIKKEIKREFHAENTHIFEFSPQDWNLIFKFSGWEIFFQKI